MGRSSMERIFQHLHGTGVAQECRSCRSGQEEISMSQKGVHIEPAEGKLGVLLVGLGAVSTTLIAGVEAVKRGLGKPIGSLTQMGTVRLGKRADNRVPRLQDFVPPPKLDDLVFGAWDIFPDDAYEAACEAKVLDRALLDPLRPALEAVRPMRG